MMRSREEGSVAPQFLASILLVAAIAAGAAGSVSAISRQVRSAESRNARMEDALEVIDLVMADLESDRTPLINSKDDPVWVRNGTVERGFEIEILPISDRINANFARPDIFQKTDLHRIFKPGKNADELRQYREDNGLSISADSYDAFFDEEALTKYITVYGWANINLIDEFAARTLVGEITGSEKDGETVKAHIDQYLLATGKIAAAKDLNQILGVQFSDAYPFINAEPAMNVNFVDPLLLREIVAYPAYGVGNPESKCAAILARRDSGGISSEQLLSLLGIDADNRLSCYFGGITWFYEVRLKAQSATYISVICRLPPKETEIAAKPRYRRIELRRKT